MITISHCVQSDSQSQSLDVVTVTKSVHSDRKQKGDEALKPFGLYNEFVIMNEKCFGES